MMFKEKMKIVTLPVSKILPNPSQPRRSFNEDELRALSNSIKENGLLQPVSVRKDGGKYYLVAGERRLRATKLAKLSKINCIISDFSGEESAILALIENTQRSDLNMFEQANAIVNLIRNWSITQQEAALKLGISQSYLANKVRLLKLSKDEQDDIVKNGLSERHARALIRIKDETARRKVLSVVIEKELNVSDTEKLIDTLEEQLRNQGKIKPTRKFIAKDIRIFINTIDHAVETMQIAGIDAKSVKEETDDYIECTIRIPKLNRLQV